MASLLFGSVSIAYQNFSPIACDISSVQASKGDTFSEALYMENALMQQPSHISSRTQNFIESSHIITNVKKEHLLSEYMFHASLSLALAYFKMLYL